MHNPIATYRIQFHKEFSFEEFEKILGYLQKLGISTVYASPVFAATPGSMHGYDGVNPHHINPEVGSEAQLKQFAELLQDSGIGWLQDIVPNHMAFHPNNAWLNDVLEKGSKSAYASFFDHSANSNLYKGPIMVPFLGSSLEEVIANKELQLAIDAKRIVLKYYDNSYPLRLRSYAGILAGSKGKVYQDIISEIQRIEAVRDIQEYAYRSVELKKKLFSDFAEELKQEIKKANKDLAFIEEISKSQHYELCHWQESDQRINFRRFFTINGLICLNIQDEEVFKSYHKLIKSLLDDGVFSGLRIDHIDGLYDPEKYLNDLRELAGEETYIIVEKILETGESIPERWPIQGNSGYDFLGLVNNLFTNSKSEEAFTDLYRKLVGKSASVHQQIHEKKAYILNEHMGGELNNLYNIFVELELADKNQIKKAGPENVKKAIGEFLIQCPVYRFYGNKFPLDKEEAKSVEELLKNISGSNKDLVPAVELLRFVLLEKPKSAKEDFNKKVLEFYQRCMQFSGPLMAKGVEDTLMYTYNRFIAHNEVGDAPDAFGISIPDFHRIMQRRQEQWPLSLNATSTHDTKRGEDVRMRLNVLSDLPTEWTEKVNEWRKLNAGLKQNNAPDANDEYLIYQTLCGAYPMPGEDEDNFKKRIGEYLQKALREAKVNSNWTSPNEDYEEASRQFAEKLLDRTKPFWKSFKEFHAKVSDYGIVNSLSQVLLKFCCPGVPDVYQGTELWDLSLVDPDNRRTVDYEKREQWLEEMDSHEDPVSLWKELWQSRNNGKIKLQLIYSLFNERKANPELFSQGEYIPLKAGGKYKKNIFAFARKKGNEFLVVALPLHFAGLCEENNCDINSFDWQDTKIILPEKIPAQWENILNKSKGESKDKIAVRELFADLPFAFLRFKKQKKRGAGILCHITSLPSPFGLGDLGPEAYKFADFLRRTNQKYWQLLPLNPTEKAQGFSPYSSVSSMAGNTLLISLELLASEGLLEVGKLANHHLKAKEKAEFEKAGEVKELLFEVAWKRFKKGDHKQLKKAFEEFKNSEKDWLNDFSLYRVIKTSQGGKPWNEWPEEFKNRDEKARKKISKDSAEEIEKVKWLQFIFFRQWKDLKRYCNKRGIKLFGDIPIYISYDSVDVWANRDIFKLDTEGKIQGIAGVPPDYFSEDGQLWGMPVFNWDLLKKQDYKWWMQRLKVNMALYDQIRIDHFRAFADFWEVPAGEETARKGIWQNGPGKHFFERVKHNLGELPFVAEDLGDINDAVLELRDELNLPGMKVLQFAFAEDSPESTFHPHNFTRNFIAYTGTHDNNTSLGWYKDEGHRFHKQLEEYAGRKLKPKDIPHELCRMAHASVAKTVILPLQDLLELDAKARMNMPGDAENNWQWRFLPGQISKEYEERLRGWTGIFNR